MNIPLLVIEKARSLTVRNRELVDVQFSAKSYVLCQIAISNNNQEGVHL